MILTLKDIATMDKPTLNAEEVAAVLGSNAEDIRNQAHRDPAKLGFPVIVHGSRVKIPRLGFLYFMNYGFPVLGDEQAI